MISIFIVDIVKDGICLTEVGLYQFCVFDQVLLNHMNQARDLETIDGLFKETKFPCFICISNSI